MRLPFPTHIKLWHSGAFATVLCLFELLEGTPPFFVLFVFVYILLATVAFNLAGGLSTPSGAYVFANASLSLIFVLCAKVLIGEAADVNLRSPMTSIMVYTGGMAGILLAVKLSHWFIPKVAILDRDNLNVDMRQIAIACIASGIIIPTIAGFFYTGAGSLGSALNQFGFFLPLGLMLAVYDQIRSSNGRSSVNIFFILGSLYAILTGAILGTSKQALFTPLAAYLVVCGAMQFRLRIIHIATLSISSFLMLYYMVPYDQIVRNYTHDATTFEVRWDTAMYWLNHLDELRAEYNISNEDVAISRGPHYFSEDRGLLERLGMIGMDDALINITEINGTYGYRPLAVAYGNIVPHFLWKNKPDYDFANVFGHELGLLAYEDFTTSIAFGPSAMAYHMGKWVGVLLIMPVVTLMLFIAVNSTTGTIERSPWTLIFTLYFLHTGPEGDLGEMIIITFLVTGIVIVSVYTARFALPLLGALFFPARHTSIPQRGSAPLPFTASSLPTSDHR